MAKTPGISAAAEGLMLEVMACAWSLRRNATCIAPGTRRSAVKAPWPVSNRGSSTRLTRAPIFFGRSPEPISAASSPDARLRPSVIKVGPLFQSVWPVAYRRDRRSSWFCSPRSPDLRPRYHRLADIPGVARGDPRSSVKSVLGRGERQSRWESADATPTSRVLTPSRRGRDSLAEGSTVDAGAVSKIAADRGAGFEPSVPVAKEPPSVWKGQLGNSRTVERGQSQKSVVPLGGTEGSNPAPSSAELCPNPTSSQRGPASIDLRVSLSAWRQRASWLWLPIRRAFGLFPFRQYWCRALAAGDDLRHPISPVCREAPTIRAFPAVTGVIVVRERPVGGGPKPEAA